MEGIANIDSVIDLVCAQHNCRFSLKQEQREAISHLVNKKDVFVVLPTGFGKSLVYQLLPLVLDEVFIS